MAVHEQSTAYKTSLVDAVTTGDAARVASLLYDGADPDHRNNFGGHMLLIAAIEGHVDVVELLLDAGANIDLSTADGTTALIRAAVHGHVNIVRLLLMRGADVHLSNLMGTALHAGARLGHEDVVEELLAVSTNGANDVNNQNGQPPIVAAAAHGNVAIAARLLAAGAHLERFDKYGQGAIYCAAHGGHVDMIRFLVLNGVDPNTTISAGGVSPLDIACRRGCATSVAALLEMGAHANRVTDIPCLYFAAGNDRADIVALLLEAGADVNAIESEEGATAMHVAAIKGHATVVRQLAYARAKLDVPTSSGATPVDFARCYGHASVLAVLQDVRTKKMELLQATRHSNLTVVRALLSEGLSVNETDEYGNTLVHLALLGRHNELVAALLTDPTIDLDCVNKFGESPTAIATKLANPSLVHELHVAQTTKAAQVSLRSTAHLQVLGRGSYGIVFKDKLFGRDVAIKTVLNSSRKAAENLRYEIQVLKDNPSPYLVRLLATAEAKSDAPQLFFEYMDGGNLTSYLEKIANDEPVPVVYTPIEILWVVANALNDLHAKNVVHRDIKPDNILLSSVHYIKVGDVGIAKEESTNMTTGAGTSKWRAPEVLTSGSGYGKAADIYSFGILLETLYPNPLDASAEWAQALAADCTAIDPTRRPTAAKLVDMLRPKLQSRPHLVPSMVAFEKDRSAGLQVVEAISVLAPPESASRPAAPTIILSKVGRAQRCLTPDEQLHVAVEAGNVDDVRKLLASGVHPDSASDDTMTPLKTAVLLQHDSIADLLLAHAANVNVNNGSTALHVAAKRGSIAMLKKLLSVKDIDVDALSEIAHTPLHDAVLHGRMAHVVALADAGADLEAADHDTRRPLHMAVLLGHNDIVAFLLERGVCTSERNQYGDTVLHLAIQTGRGDITALLIEAGADIHAVTNEQSPLYLACESGALDVVLALLARGADINAKCNGHCPLFISILADHADVVAALMASPGIDFNQRYSGGATLLHLAATKGSVDIVQTLLQAGVDFDVREKMVAPAHSGQSAMDLATRQGNPEVLALIGAAHAHATKLLIAVVLQDEQRFAALLQHPFSCNFSDEIGCSLVHWAVLTRNETMLDLLLATPRVLLATQNHEHKTPLALAIEFGCTSMAKKLFDRVQPRVVEIAATDYEVTTTQLGVGGFGVVLLGFYMDQKVAVKILKNAEHRKSFHAEAKALRACPSQYLVQLVAIADRGSETPALLFEYMDGGSLRTHLEKKRMNERTPVHVTNLHVAWVIANALRDLHAAKLVHRDIKSDNVLLSSSGEVKLADLGLARLEATDMTEAPGTRYWMAPEILQAQGTTYGCPADIYAFGVLLTELNTCQVPYFDQDVQDRIAFTRGVINGTLRPTLTDDSEPWLRTLVEMCLRSDPAARPTADQVLETLQREVTAVAVPGMSTTEVFMRIAAIDDVDAAAHMLTSGLHVDGALPGGVSLLSAAIAAGAPNTVQLLVDRGASVNVQSGGMTPLHEAVARRSSHVLRILIDAGADVDARDHMGKTPLDCALQLCNGPCIKPLLATGANVEIPTADEATTSDTDRLGRFLTCHMSLLTIAASRKEIASLPEIFCVDGCGNWHPIEADCSCGHHASTHDRVAAVIRRLMRLHHRGYPVTWARTCAACHESTMTIMDVICPECAYVREDESELKMLHVRLKMALKSTASQLVAKKDVRAIPRSIVRWLAATRAPPPSPPSGTVASTDNWEPLKVRNSPADRFACSELLVPHPHAMPCPARDQSTLTSAEAIDPAALARDLLANLVHPVRGVSPVPAPGASFSMHGDIVTHRLIGDDEDLDAIARCTSPYLVPIVAAILPKSLLVGGNFASLRQLMAEHKDAHPGPLIEIEFGHAVASALVDVHANGLVHGYLSSHNVFFSPALKVHVGVPGTSATDDALLAWTAPEVLTGDAPPSSASDIYAFGILMTELDTLKLPYEDDAFEDEVALTIAVVDGGYRPALRDSCEEWLQDLVDRCVDADPNLRPTAVELAASLQKLLDQATRPARSIDP